MMLEAQDPRGRRGPHTSMTVCFHLLLDFLFLTILITVNAIIFLAPISAFDQTLAEDPKVNRLEDSMLLWKSVVSNKLLENVNIILFLNKVDLFKQKLARSPLSNYFPDYSGGNDVNRAAKYLLWRFNQVNRAHLNLYPQ